MKTGISDLKQKIWEFRGDGCLNTHDLFLFRVFERHDKIVVCAQVHRNMHFTLGYSRWEVKCSIKCDINARRWNAWMRAPRESAGILLTGKMSAFCTQRRNSGIWTTLRESGRNAGILVFDQFAKENLIRCSNFCCYVLDKKIYIAMNWHF